MVVQSSKIRFLKAWAEQLSLKDAEEVEHAVEVFAQARRRVTKQTARKYAWKVLTLLELPEVEKVGETT